MTDPLDRTRREMQTMARVMDDHFNGTDVPKKTCFVLLIMPFDGAPGSRVNYVSNGQRDDVLTMLKELTARFEDKKREEIMKEAIDSIKDPK